MPEHTPFPPFRTRVSRVQQLSPGFIRVTLAGDDLRHYAPHGWDQRIKIVLELPNGGYGDFGILDEPRPALSDWFPRWRALPDAERNLLRTFTASGIRPEDAEIDIDFVIHEPAGPASRWASSAKPGAPLIIIGPDVRADDSTGGIDYRPGAATDVLLVADETAIPAVRNILTQTPHDVAVTAIVEAAHARDLDTLQTQGSKQHLVRAVRTTKVGDQALSALADWLDMRPSHDDATYCWLAGESGFVKRARRTLVHDHRIPKGAVTFTGYWKLGQTEN